MIVQIGVNTKKVNNALNLHIIVVRIINVLVFQILI